MAKAKPKAQHNRVASRTDVQFVGAFVAGCLVPFAGGAIGALVSNALWEALSNSFTDQLNVLINGAIFAAVVLVYLAGFVALSYGYARLLSLRLPFMAVTRALLPVGLLAVASLTFSLQTYMVAINTSVWLDLFTVGLFGLGYVLGWWATRRYAKL